MPDAPSFANQHALCGLRRIFFSRCDLCGREWMIEQRPAHGLGILDRER
jgi:hypothetical protein